MKALFSEEERLRQMLWVEAALARAHAVVGNIPEDAAKAISKAARGGKVTVAQVSAIEARISHDVMAMVTALSEASGDAGRYVHLGATSNDITDTATALQIREALELIEDSLKRLRDTLLDLAEAHRDTVMLGRTHGQAAVPITFGLKMAVYALEVNRHISRLFQGRARICVGKMSGAVGTGAALGPKALEIQERVMEDLGLGVEEAASQIVGRDRYVELVALLANIAASCEKFATEVRLLQRTEVGEAAEAFDAERQVGSSTMAHKRNPITSENICGLSRIARSLLVPAMENVPTWHERDLTNSSAERFIIPHAIILTDDVLVKTAEVFRNLQVYPERMAENLAATRGLVMAEAVMIALVERGVPRPDAHELVRRRSMEAEAKRAALRDVLMDDDVVVEKLGDQLDAILDPASYTGVSGEIIDRVLKICGRG
jgi:adenylosuccinate lyase